LNVLLGFSVTFRTVEAQLSAEIMKRVRFPIEVKRGSSVVKIYRDRKPEGTYYRVTYYLDGHRQRLCFHDLQAAINEAELKASHHARADRYALEFVGKDRLEYGRAKDAVTQFGLPLDAVANEYKEARKLLDGVPLIEAARFYEKHNLRGIKRKNVEAAVNEMIAAKTTKGVSEVYLADLRYRLGAFREAFHCDVNAIAPDEVTAFFDNLRLSPRSHNNFLRTLRTFFVFAQRHGWLSKELDLLERVERRSEKRTPVEVFTPPELVAILGSASQEVAPCIALASFAGLRSVEILRLDWSDIERRPGFIEVAADKAKTATRRIVPIAENLAKWLAIAPRNGERVWPHSKDRFFKALVRAARNANITWKQNVLRHSFISYRLAETQNINSVSLEAGNSPQMIFRHYRELATPEQAKTWFASAPEAAPNVVPISAASGRR
jgi:integrase